MQEKYCLALKILKKRLSEVKEDNPELLYAFYRKMQSCSNEIIEIFGPKTENLLTGKNEGKY
jgi:hypothetical protein